MVKPVATAMVGGSFNPVHLGHLHLIHTVVTTTRYRRFIFIPVSQNNFKRDASLADAHHRLAMLHLGFSAYGRLYPDDPPLELVSDACEIERGGVSYTYDTVKHLYLQYGIRGRLGLVMGDDLLASLDTWHEYDKLKELVSFVVIRRDKEATPFHDHAVDLEYIENMTVDDSSTAIREACALLHDDEALGEDVRSLMPEEVASYVQQNRLYRS
ncbi:MAG: nicotinate (nicotinamide) nucleotide adenylyltransferase [Spirochaetia bacterium]|nr:nicotinate (nicotinamide) nucleotide adenylyltransferase [Spirochaetia bacterium]